MSILSRDEERQQSSSGNVRFLSCLLRAALAEGEEDSPSNHLVCWAEASCCAPEGVSGHDGVASALWLDYDAFELVSWS